MPTRDEALVLTVIRRAGWACTQLQQLSQCPSSSWVSGSERTGQCFPCQEFFSPLLNPCSFMHSVLQPGVLHSAEEILWFVSNLLLTMPMIPLSSCIKKKTAEEFIPVLPSPCHSTVIYFGSCWIFFYMKNCPLFYSNTEPKCSPVKWKTTELGKQSRFVFLQQQQL